MKTITMIVLCSVMLSGCGLAFWSCAGIPATEYVAYEKRNNGDNASVIIPVTTGLVAAHGGVTYLLWGVCWPAAVAYLGVSGMYTVIRIAIEEAKR